MDMYILLDRLPGKGETVLGNEFQMKPGGKGANQAVAAARAGSQVYLVANLGDDLFGRNMVNTFEKERVAIDFVSQDRAHPTGVAMIMVDGAGENLIAVAPGANSYLAPDQVKKSRPRAREADFVLLQLEIPPETVEFTIRMAYDDRTPVMLNAAPAPREAVSRDLVAKVDTLIVNEYEAAVLTGIGVETDADAERAAKALQSMGARRVVVTLGAKGALGLAEAAMYAPARKVQVVDTVGAGDAFCGALVTALSEKMYFSESLSFANAAAALACAKVGAQSSLPSRVDIESFWKQ